MYIATTEHFKGRYPIDLGGITLHGGPYIPKLINDHLGPLVEKANFPIAVLCDANGKPLREVPPVVVAPVAVVPVAKAETKSEADPTVATEADVEVPGTPQDQPVVEEVVETKGKKKGK